MGNFWKNRNVFVTGAGGFVGSWLSAALLQQGAKVVVLLRDHVPESNFYRLDLERNVTIVRGTLLDYDIVSRAIHEYAVDSCFHLAAQSIVGVANRSPRSTFESNIQGTWNVLEACRTSGSAERIVVASSDKAYGSQKQLPCTEDAPVAGAFPYDASKACVDILARCFAETYAMPIAVARCVNIYGGGDLNFSRLVPGTIRSVFLDQPPLIRSDGTLLRDYLFIDDAVRAYLALGEQTDAPEVRGAAFNFGTQTPVSVLDLVREIIEIAGTSHLVPEILGISTNEISAQYVSSAKAEAQLGWKPQVSLHEGLKRTIGWYRELLGR